MRINGQNSTCDQIFNTKFETPWAVSYSTTNFGGAKALTTKFMRVLSKKNGFCNAKFSEFWG